MDAKKMMAIIIVCALAIAAVGVYLIYADKGNKDTLNVAYLDKSGYEAIIMADENGYFNDLDFNVGLKAVTGSGNDSVEKLLLGEVDIAATGDGPYINALKANPNEIKVLCSYNLSENGQVWVARTGSGIPSYDSGATPEDRAEAIKGKVVGIIQGSTTETVFKKWCAEYGLTAVVSTTPNAANNEVGLAYIANGTLLVENLALSSGSQGAIDIMAASNPFPIQAIDAGYGYMIGGSIDLDIKGVAVLVTTKTIYEQKESMIKEFLGALKKSTDYMSDENNLQDCITKCASRINWSVSAQANAFENSISVLSFDDEVIDTIAANAGTKLTRAQIVASCPTATFLIGLYV